MKPGFIEKLQLIRIKHYNHLLNQEFCDCTKCTKMLKAKDMAVKKTVETANGKFDLYRPYFYCSTCKIGFYPLDEALGLASSTKQYDIQDGCPSQDEIDAKIVELSKGKTRRPVMMMAIDGAQEPIRPEPSPWKGKRGKYEYKEAKWFRLF